MDFNAVALMVKFPTRTRLDKSGQRTFHAQTR